MSLYYYRLLREILARLDAEVADRRAWINELAARYGIVRLAASLTAEELAAQQDMVDYALGRKFMTTTPLPGMMLDSDGVWHQTEPI